MATLISQLMDDIAYVVENGDNARIFSVEEHRVLLKALQRWDACEGKCAGKCK